MQLKLLNVTIENAPDDDAIDLIDNAAKEMADKLND